MRMVVGIACPAAIQRVASMKQEAYKKEFEEVIKPFLLEKSYIPKEEFDARLKIVADKVWRRFKNCVGTDAYNKTSKIFGVDKDDWINSCMGEAALGVMVALRNMPSMEIGQFTVYIRKAIAQSVANELTKLYGYTQGATTLNERSCLDPQETTDKQLELQRFYAIVSCKLQLLSEEDKELLDAYFHQEKNYRMIGEEIGTTKQAVCLRVSMAIGRLRELFTREELESCRDIYREIE